MRAFGVNPKRSSIHVRSGFLAFVHILRRTGIHFGENAPI